MSDPSNEPTFDWALKVLGWIGTGAVAGMTGAAAWFRNAKERLHRRMATLEKRMDDYTKAQADHNTEIAVIHTNQDHMSKRLHELREGIKSSHDKLDELLRRRP